MAALVFMGYFGIVFLAVIKAVSGPVPSFALPLAIGLLPFLGYLALRYPMVFPFGLYVAMVPFDSLLAVSGGGSATLGKFVAIATAGTMIFHALLLRRAFVPNRSWMFWGAMTMYIVVSLLWTSDSKNGILVAQSVIQLFLFMTILAMYPATKKEFMAGLTIVVGCGIIAAAYAIQQYLAGNFSVDEGARVELSSNNVVLDPNYFAASFALPISLAMCFTFYAKSIYSRIVSGAATLFLLAGLLVTGSRGGFIAACSVFVYFAIRSKYKVQIGGFLLALGSVTLLFPSVYARFANDPSGQQGSASGRTFIWQTGLFSIKDHFWFGNGVGSYADTYDRNFLNVFQAAFQGWSRPSHSILVGGITELGVVGLLLVLAAWYVSFRQLKVIPKTSEWYGLRLAFEGSIFALFVMSLSIDPTYIKFIWLAHAMVLMLLNQAVPRVIRLERSPLQTVAPRREAYVVSADVESSTELL